MSKRNQKGIWKSFFRFYKHVHIPWYLFVGSIAAGILYAEMALKLTELTIQVNKGELYNSVIISYVLISVGSMLIASAGNILSAFASAKMTRDGQNVLWKKILSLPEKDVDEEGPSELISAVTVDLATSSECMELIFSSVSRLYAFVRAWIAMIQFSGDMALLTMLTVPLMVLIFFIVGRMQYHQSARIYEAINTMTSWFSSHLTAAKYVKTQCLEEKEVEDGLRAIDARYKADLFNTFLLEAQTSMVSVEGKINSIIRAVGGSNLITQGKLASTALTDTDGYITNIYSNETALLTSYKAIKGTQGSLKHVLEILNRPEEDLEKGKDAELAGDISFRNVGFSFDGEHPVLKNVSFTIPYGKKTAIVGSNGSGKSTALKLLQGFYAPEDGEILIGGENTAEVKLSCLRKQFAYVLQNAPLFAGTIRENIAYGVSEEAGEEALELAATEAGIHEFIQSLSDGYDTMVGADGMSLSGGQRQRIALARALIVQPRYLILDESTASLDHETAQEVFSSVLEKEGQTVIFISHNMDEVQQADYVIVFAGGTVEAEGTPEEVLTTSPTYRTFCQVQKAGEVDA